MTLPSTQDLDILESEIYLPMLLIIFERDNHAIEVSQVKFKRPYLLLIKAAMNMVKLELIATHKYMENNNLQVIRGRRDELFTEFIFLVQGKEDTRKYSNIRLRNHVEELLVNYYSKVVLLSGAQQ
ncbi:hypothetical protein [Kurthia sibirica]|uniref:Uncharacterized protein n=1 Tax=Kurthia sibirica TaxID=202750 RepID=A0A2U3AMS5_9BACL|nr:hypothetical protein [Kurthia sibirica]PWI25816.1 hypothetical protein DEX24_06330 [Kurthia sibirica]GEK33635.1 hypothetical protein KSI01_11680 [Kurthia sibirica]